MGEASTIILSKQSVFIHVDPENITMGCPNPVQGAPIKFESTLGWGIPRLCSQDHMNGHTLLNNVMTAKQRTQSI
jgi:hypothetical protein